MGEILQSYGGWILIGVFMFFMMRRGGCCGGHGNHGGQGNHGGHENRNGHCPPDGEENRPGTGGQENGKSQNKEVM